MMVTVFRLWAKLLNDFAYKKGSDNLNLPKDMEGFLFFNRGSFAKMMVKHPISGAYLIVHIPYVALYDFTIQPWHIPKDHWKYVKEENEREAWYPFFKDTKEEVVEYNNNLQVKILGDQLVR